MGGAQFVCRSGAKMRVGMVPKERKYRFRIKEHERFIILEALEDLSARLERLHRSLQGSV